MTKSEMKLAAEFLRMAADKFSNNSCNDFELPKDWPQQECDEFTLAMQAWNGDSEEHNPGSRLTMDWLAMDYLASRLDTDADNAPVSIKPFPLFEPLQKNVAVSFINDADQLQKLREAVNRVGMVKNVDSTRDVETGKWNTVLTIGPVE